MDKLVPVQKIIILSRHGERTDFCTGNSLDLINPTDDPELTKRGKEQALNMGKLLKEYLYEEFDITLSYENFQIVSSPFTRALQTTLGLLAGYNLDSAEILVDNQLSERMYKKVNVDIPKNFLSLYAKSQDKSFLNKFEENEKININYKEKLTLNSLPYKYEDENDVLVRVKASLEQNIEAFLMNTEQCVLQLVSHGPTLSVLRNYIMSVIKKDVNVKKKNSRQNFNDITYEYYDFCDSDVFVLSSGLSISNKRKESNKFLYCTKVCLKSENDM